MVRIPYNKGIDFYKRSRISTKQILNFFLTPVPRAFMLGSGFSSFLHEIDRTQWLAPKALKKYQEVRLRAIIKHAYMNVPYYHRIFKAKGIRPEDIKTCEDMRKIPILTKDDLRNHFKELIAVNARDYQYGVSGTSGSTGKPAIFYLDQQNREIEYALKWRQREWANIGLNDPIAAFIGFRGLQGIDYQSGKPRWLFNALSKELEFNILGLNNVLLRQQAEKLRKFCPRLIVGYPSAIELLAKYILKQNIKDICPVAIQTSSESLFTRREVIEKAFKCKVYDRYGQSEYSVSASECPEGNYHIGESGIMEFIKDGEQTSYGEVGEIVGTGLHNFSMPLIRYRTTDLGRFSKEPCKCNRGLPIMQSIEGRASDSIVASDGRIITGVAFEHYWKSIISHFAPNLDYVHVIQRLDKRILIRFVTKKVFSNEERLDVINGLKSLLGSEMEIEFEELDSSPIQKKWRFTESELDIRLI